MTMWAINHTLFCFFVFFVKSDYNIHDLLQLMKRAWWTIAILTIAICKAILVSIDV